MQYRGIEYLKNKLNDKRNRVLLRYEYYEMKKNSIERSPVIPGNLEQIYRSKLGWCSKAVDSLADRLVFKGFDKDTDNFMMNEVFEMNNPDVLFDSAILGALISSCDFVYITKDLEGYPRLQVIDGANATGIIDPITGMLTEGYAVLERNDADDPVTEVYFTAENTTVIYNEPHAIKQYSEPNPTLYPLLVPIIYRPDANRPFGHSRISRACMRLEDKARQTMTRADICSEFYTIPQRWVVGLSQEAEALDTWKATVSSMLQFTKDDDGDKPTLGQFQAASMAPYIEQFRMYASAFAGETGLTLDDLGFLSENPSSAEAIKAGHENLRLTARKAQRTFGTGFLNVGYLAISLRDNKPYERKAIYQTKPIWEPIFEPDAAMLSSIGDGAIKINQAIPDFFGQKNLENLTGIRAE